MRDAARAVADACLADLPEKYRTLVWVVDVEGMPLAEASRHLATGEALLGARLHRARQMLARALCRRCQPRA
jgi:DNA-directed RNA polymerase specialized sigma24 family protein